MLKNYIKLAWRNMMKNKAFSFINVFGLAIGLTCCMLIGLYIYHEFSYDSHHANAKNLYQLGTTFTKADKGERMANTPAPMARSMQQEFPEIVKATRLVRMFSDDKTLLQYTPDNGAVTSFYETQGYLADSNFFQLFTYRFKEGNPAQALAEPNSVVLSEEIAHKFFGNEPATGKVLRISSSTNGDYDFRVTGVFIPSSTPSHINARFFMTIAGGGIAEYMRELTSLASNNFFYTYFELKDGSDPKQLEAKFPAFIDKYAGPDLRAMGFYKTQFLTAVKDVHLHAKTSSNVTPDGSVTYLYILASIALFTLVIACINFMNLSTARSSRRAAEVGVRKVLGAEKSSLVRQFLGESVLMSFMALLVALAFAKAALPLFSRMTQKELYFSWQEHWVLMIGFFLLAVITGLIAGSYPAFYLSSFRPIKVLKGKISNSFAAISLRKALVVLQFVISAILIIASVTIQKQVKYMMDKDLGFTKEQQIVIPLRSDAAKGIYASFKNELKRNPQILSAGASKYYPGIFNPSDMPIYKDGSDMNHSKRVFVNHVDEDFLQTIGITPVAGRLFSKEFPADTGYRMILNEEAIRQLEFDKIGSVSDKRVKVDWQGETYTFDVIGIVKDFHFKNMHSPIEPFAFQRSSDSDYNYIIAHAAAGDISKTLRSIENTWKSLNPNEPFEYTFLDEDFQKNYAADNQLLSMVSNFTVLAILISCLGLFGLATFSAEQRTKEIGVRKVLGASVGSIVGLLSKEFLKLVLIAVMIASPVAWWIMHTWLKDFAYTTSIGWTVFVITASIASFIAMLTISVQAIRAAMANPVKSLRTE